MLHWLSRIKYSLVAFKTVKEIPDSWFLRNVSIVGLVTRVGDGDGFRILHYPKYPLVRVPTTLSVRLAGVDAPEVIYFNNVLDGTFWENSSTIFSRSKELAL
jgi:endonuclease YncB( thermonuclease family)